MTPRDGLTLVLGAVRTHRLRTLLTATGIGIGIAAVVLLTAIGEGVHRYVLGEFSQFGTNLIGVSPGKTSTFGMPGGVFGTTRPLTIDDSEALRRVPEVLGLVPVVQGNARIEAGRRARRTEVLGVGPDALDVWSFQLARGRFLPVDDPRTARPFAVLGAELAEELFADKNPLGQAVRIGDWRFRIIGVMARRGRILGFDIDRAIYVPAARALELFNRVGLMEIDLLYRAGADSKRVEAGIRRALTARHGREDFTMVTQEQMLETLDDILAVLTAGVGALGGISLLVGGVGILTVLTISVSERTAEIGLLRALGARQRQVLGLFLGEAVVLSALGGVAGLIVGLGTAFLLAAVLPDLPIRVSLFYTSLSLTLAVAIGLVAGVLPARRAARLDPVSALRGE